MLLKEKNKNFFTIIAPRHIQRARTIQSICRKFNLNAQILNYGDSIDPKNEIIILNSFGILQNYFKYAKSVFIGKSTIKKLKNDGGQNPLEAAKLNCKIYHGPYVYNFKDIYEILKNNISFIVNDHNELNNYLRKDFESHNKKDDKIVEIIKELGDKTLSNTLKSINEFISNESLKPKFWNSKFSILPYLLLPLSLLVLIYNFLKRNIVSKKKFKIPIICIGNIYVGGTGKTPASILIAQEISKKGKNPVILRKFYKKHLDEHNLIKANYDNLILNKDRVKGIKIAESSKFDAVILDDGFQDFKLKNDLNKYVLIVINLLEMVL